MRRLSNAPTYGSPQQQQAWPIAHHTRTRCADDRDACLELSPPSGVTTKYLPIRECVSAWVEDTGVTSICGVKPLNAVTAWHFAQPLSAGILFREPVSHTYRTQPHHAVQSVFDALAGRAERTVALCALGSNGLIKACVFWSSNPRSPAAPQI